MSSIYDGSKYLYAEMLKGKRVSLTIKSVTGGIEFDDGRGKKSTGFDLAFEETPKILGITGITVRRQLAMSCGTDDPAGMVGKKIVLYAVKSTRSATGLAIRIAVPEQMA
jgi:hypothetical protein